MKAATTAFLHHSAAQLSSCDQRQRRLHKINQTTLLETWSFYTDRRPLLDHLKEILEKEGFVLKPRNLEEVYRKVVNTGKDKYIYKLIVFMVKIY